MTVGKAELVGGEQLAGCF